jgi:hypothetical protein
MQWLQIVHGAFPGARPQGVRRLGKRRYKPLFSTAASKGSMENMPLAIFSQRPF